MKNKNNFSYKIILFLTMCLFSLFADDVNLVKSNGVYHVPVYLNESIKLNFIVDTGASNLTLSNDVFKALVKNGTISKKDVITVKKYQIANGDIVENLVVNIKQLNIGNLELYNIEASVSKNTNAPLLLGQNVLQNLEPWQMDYKNNIFIIKNSNKKDNHKYWEKYLKYLAKKCKSGNYISCHKMALEIKKVNTINNAIDLFKESCDNHNYYVFCYELGKVYESDLKMKNFDIATKYYKKACNNGNYYEACNNLAGIYASIQDDIVKEKLYRKKACSGGVAIACSILGYNYKNIKNYKKAKYFFKKGCAGGEDWACSELNDFM